MRDDVVTQREDREVHWEEQFQSMANQDASSVKATGHLVAVIKDKICWDR